MIGREYEPWARPRLVVDTAETRAEEAARRVSAEMATARQALEPGRRQTMSRR